MSGSPSENLDKVKPSFGLWRLVYIRSFLQQWFQLMG